MNNNSGGKTVEARPEGLLETSHRPHEACALISGPRSPNESPFWN
jgi:hypothetical protein